MRPHFQADADFNHKIVRGLRRREPSVDFLSAQEGGVVGVPDPDVLRIAAESDRVLISHDRKTMPAHFAQFREKRESPGLIIVSQHLDIGAAIEDLLLIRADTEAEEWVGGLASCRFKFNLHREIHFQRLNQRHQPTYKLLVNGMRPIRIERRTVSKLHHPA
jgi:hypothetical protein